ncbi:PDZ domain-containing protein [Streptomyces sp. PmtG]
MEQTALRPKPMPGREPHSDRAPDRGHRPHAARRRGKRITTLLLGLLCAAVLLLTGVGLGTVGAAVIGMSRLAETQRQAGTGAPGQGQGASGPTGQKTTGSRPSGAGASAGAEGKAPSTATAGTPSRAGAQAARTPGPRPVLGVDAVDAPGGSGALLVGVRVPGPGHSAGLVRGDAIVALGATRVRSAADLARAVAAAHPGRNVTLTVRHAGGSRQVLTAAPGIAT